MKDFWVIVVAFLILVLLIGVLSGGVQTQRVHIKELEQRVWSGEYVIQHLEQQLQKMTE